jgi:hypothetical protein
MLFCQKVITVFCQMLQAANVGFCRVLALVSGKFMMSSDNVVSNDAEICQMVKNLLFYRQNQMQGS